LDSQAQHNRSDEEILSIDFRRYAGSVLKYKWVILAIVAMAITAAVLYTSRQTELYEATASIRIDPKLPDLLGQGQEIVQIGAGQSPTAEYYKAERTLLTSYQLIRRTVESNDLHLHLLEEHERESQTQDEVFDLATRRLKLHLSVTYPEQNRVMYVTVRSRSAQRAADIANAHVRTYVDYSRGLISDSTKQASRSLSSEFDLAEKNLRDSETKLVEFQKANDIIAVSLEDRQNLVAANITHYTEKQNNARARRLELASVLQRMRKLPAEDVLESPIFGLGGTDSLETLKNQYYLERNKFLEVEKEVGPKHVLHQKQKAKVDDLYGAIKDQAALAIRTVEEQLQATLATEQALGAEVERYKQEAFELGPKIVAYNQLLRKKKSDEDRYNIVVARLGLSDMTNRLDKSIDRVNVTPIDEARAPKKSVWPSMQRNVVLAGTFSLLLGIGLALLLAFLDRSVKTIEDVQAAASVPVLGIIPLLEEDELPRTDDKARDLYVHEHPTSRVAECCRSLRTNIIFSGADRPLKTLVVSSANPREGKTTSVIYLGTTMAQSGQKVLLIDTDMRRPRLHVSTGVSRQTGLTNLIVGDASYDDVIKTTDIPNLYVLPCGPLPPNPAELLMTKRFEAVLEELESRFDRIILDSPPLQAVTDAVVLSRHTDGVILVVRAGKTLRDEVTRSVRNITDVDGHLFGVILNELDIEDRRYGYYYHYYGYGYGREQAGEAEPA
jgi:polysaccharide biosynthesis transport protein